MTTPMPPEYRTLPCTSTPDQARRVAQRELRRVVTRHHAVHPDVIACAHERARLSRIRNVRLRIAALKDHVARCGAASARAMAPPAPRGFVSRGWWYPRWLLLGVFWAAVAALGGLLVFGLLTHPGLQA